MRTEEDFLEALRESPQDDDLRLVFSDWLEDQDDGRAAFLRLQVQRRRLAPDDPGLANLLRQQDDLLRRSLNGWLAPLAAYGVTVMRGSGLLQVAMTADQLRELNPDAQAAPAWYWVDGLRLYKLEAETVTETLAAPGLAHFRHLDLSKPPYGIGHLAALAASPHLDRLTSLDLEEGYLSYDAGVILAGARWLRQLRGLNLARNSIGDVGIRDLIQAGSFDNLRVFELRRCGLGTLALEAIVGASFFPRLEALGLEGNKVRNAGGRLLAASPHIERFQVLDLRDNGITIRIQNQLRKRCPGLVL
jgi:uncharacterized protein (TIGR02996 family)